MFVALNTLNKRLLNGIVLACSDKNIFEFNYEGYGNVVYVGRDPFLDEIVQHLSNEKGFYYKPPLTV